GCAHAKHAHPVAPGYRTVPRPGAIEDRGHNRGRAAEQGHAVEFDAAQDLGAVDLPQHDVPAAHARDRVRHPPAVAVEHRERPEIYVAITHAGLPTERRRVDPEGAVRELLSLGPRGGPTR